MQLARTLGYVAIAEGVEHAAQAESLRALGCSWPRAITSADPATTG